MTFYTTLQEVAHDKYTLTPYQTVVLRTYFSKQIFLVEFGGREL